MGWRGQWPADCRAALPEHLAVLLLLLPEDPVGASQQQKTLQRKNTILRIQCSLNKAEHR